MRTPKASALRAWHSAQRNECPIRTPKELYHLPLGLGNDITFSNIFSIFDEPLSVSPFEGPPKEEPQEKVRRVSSRKKKRKRFHRTRKIYRPKTGGYTKSNRVVVMKGAEHQHSLEHIESYLNFKDFEALATLSEYYRICKLQMSRGEATGLYREITRLARGSISSERGQLLWCLARRVRKFSRKKWGPKALHSRP